MLTALKNSQDRVAATEVTRRFEPLNNPFVNEGRGTYDSNCSDWFRGSNSVRMTESPVTAHTSLSAFKKWIAVVRRGWDRIKVLQEEAVKRTITALEKIQK